VGLAVYRRRELLFEEWRGNIGGAAGACFRGRGRGEARANAGICWKGARGEGAAPKGIERAGLAVKLRGGAPGGAGIKQGFGSKTNDGGRGRKQKKPLPGESGDGGTWLRRGGNPKLLWRTGGEGGGGGVQQKKAGALFFQWGGP